MICQLGNDILIQFYVICSLKQLLQAPAFRCCYVSNSLDPLNLQRRFGFRTEIPRIKPRSLPLQADSRPSEPPGKPLTLSFSRGLGGTWLFIGFWLGLNSWLPSSLSSLGPPSQQHPVQLCVSAVWLFECNQIICVHGDPLCALMADFCIQFKHWMEVQIWVRALAWLVT